MIRADQLWIDIMLLFCKSFRREIQYTAIWKVSDRKSNYLLSMTHYMYIRCHKKISSRGLIFIYNPESKEDIHLAHIELPITSPQPLTDPRAAIVFQPTARASPAHTKTYRRCVHKL